MSQEAKKRAGWQTAFKVHFQLRIESLQGLLSLLHTFMREVSSVWRRLIRKLINNSELITVVASFTVLAGNSSHGFDLKISSYQNGCHHLVLSCALQPVLW